MAFSLERYLAICHPLYVLPLSDQSRVAGVSCTCWLAAMLFSLPHLLFTKAVPPSETKKIILNL